MRSLDHALKNWLNNWSRIHSYKSIIESSSKSVWYWINGLWLCTVNCVSIDYWLWRCQLFVSFDLGNLVFDYLFKLWFVYAMNMNFSWHENILINGSRNSIWNPMYPSLNGQITFEYRTKTYLYFGCQYYQEEASGRLYYVQMRCSYQINGECTTHESHQVAI
jgi:hypothetical protein